MGGVGTGAGFQNNVRALASIRLRMRVLHDAANPRLESTIFGETIAMPILAGPLGGAKLNANDVMPEDDFALATIQGARLAGSMGMGGDGPMPILLEASLKAIRKVGGVIILKPRPNDQIIERLRKVEEAGACAVGIDIDAAGLLNMVRAGQPVGPKTVAELQEIAQATRLPLILKGVMSVEDATAACRAGAAAIVVSNHGGRAIDHTPGTAEALPAIVKAVKGYITILADGGIRNGVDALKMLALGAEAVLVGRPLVVGAAGAGAEGVRAVLDKMMDELRAAMILTGCHDLSEVGPQVLWKG
jgi:isopentenyl diphosphate isomerase/L-lactate dehydrogenase-like FMN-dependent dehydrogenase